MKPSATATANRLRDLAERRVAELETIIDLLPVSVYIGDSSGNTLCNRVALDLLGFASFDDLKQNIVRLADVVQTRWPDTGERITPEDVPFARALRGEACTQEIAFTNIATGREVVAQCVAVPFQQNDAAGGAIAVLTDITERRRAEEALWQTEERFRLLVEGAQDYAIFLLDTGGRIASWNLGAQRILGYEEAEILGQPASIIFRPEDQEAGVPQREMATAEATGQAEDKRWHLRKDGSPFWADGVMTSLRAEDGILRGFAKIMRDATEQRRAEKALRESEELLRFALEATELGTWELDLATQTARRSRRHDQIFGYDTLLPVWTYAMFFQHVHPDDRASVQGRYDHALATGTDWHFECRILRRDGVLRWIEARGRHLRDAGGAPTRVVGTVADITERKAAQAALAAAAEKQQRIAETLQRSLLLTPPANAFPGIEISTRYEAAWEEAQVGGDFYDAFQVDGGKVALVVGDVTGKGLAAATHTAEIKFALRAYLRENSNPACALRRLNHFLMGAQRLDAHPRDALASLALAVVDTRTGDMAVTAAGAEPPLLLRTSGEAVEIRAGGMLLGADPEAEYESATLHLEPGDTLAFVTDGITEARRGHEFFGYEALIRTVQETRTLDSLEEAAQTIIEKARQFAGGTLHDDACLLLLRRHRGDRAGPRAAGAGLAAASRLNGGPSAQEERDALL